MAKDKQAKELRRAKRNKELKIRRAEHKRKSLKTRDLIMDERTARGLSAFWSHDLTRQRNGVIARKVPVPSYYREFLALMGVSGIRREVNALIETMSQMGSRAPGFVIVLNATGWEPLGLPIGLVAGSVDPIASVRLAIKDKSPADLVVWMTWFGDRNESAPVVWALDMQGQLAVWALDEDRCWLPLSQPDEFLAFLSKNLVRRSGGMRRGWRRPSACWASR